MAGYVQVPPDGAGKKIDTAAITDDLETVYRQKVVLAGGSGSAETVVVTNTVPSAAMMGVVVRCVGGVALLASSAVIGAINSISRTVAVSIATPFTIDAISATVQVAISTPFTVQGISTTVTVAGSVNIGTMPNVVISAMPAVTGTVNISGGVALAAGTANIGDLNAISRTVQVAIGTPFTLQGISTTVQVAIGTPFTVNGISATVVTVKGHLPQLPSASHGPRCVTASTSAGVVLVAAPGAGFAVYVTSIACTNGSGTLTRADVFQGSATASAHCTMYMAASGGGFTMNYDPPIALLSGTGVTCRVKPNVSKAIFNVHFYVDPK